MIIGLTGSIGMGKSAVAFEILFHVEPPRDRDEDLRALLTQ